MNPVLQILLTREYFLSENPLFIMDWERRAVWMHFYCRAISLLLFQWDESSIVIKALGFLVLSVAFPILLVGVTEKVLIIDIFSWYKIWGDICIFYKDLDEQELGIQTHLNKTRGSAQAWLKTSQHSPKAFCFLYLSQSNSWAPLCVQVRSSLSPSHTANRWQSQLVAQRALLTTTELCCRGRRRCYVAKHCSGKTAVLPCRSYWMKLISKQNFNCSASVLNSLEAESRKRHQLSLWLCFSSVVVCAFGTWFVVFKLEQIPVLFCFVTWPFNWKFLIILKFQLVQLLALWPEAQWANGY